MPLPLFLLIGAAIAGTTGIGLGISGGVKMKKAGDRMKKAKVRNEYNIKRLETQNTETCKVTDSLGTLELNILAGFKKFSDEFEKIHNRPSFEEIKRNDFNPPVFSGEDIEKASIGASILIGGLGGAALGTAGGFAASGATTAAVMALGTASTGTLISTLSGAAATNATLAALGGGSLAAGGGGMALGSTVLGASTLGVGLLVGGVIFSIVGSNISGKADKAEKTVKENETKINKIIRFLIDLSRTAKEYESMLYKIKNLYDLYIKKMINLINHYTVNGISPNWNTFNHEDKVIIENTILLIGCLYNTCKVNIVKEEKAGQNIVNYNGIKDAKKNVEQTLQSIKDSQEAY